jgi:hypothetical protein
MLLASVVACGQGVIAPSHGDRGRSGSGGDGDGGSSSTGSGGGIGTGGDFTGGGGTNTVGGTTGSGGAPEEDAGTGTGGSVAEDAATSGGGGSTYEAGAGHLRHPGVLVNGDQLTFLRGKVAAGAEPWKTAFDHAKRSDYGSLSYTAHPRAIVQCGSYSNPDYGCTDETNDANAAYTLALLWALTGTRDYAAKAVEILNAWSAVLMDHTDSNAPLQAAWSGSLFPRGAEIIRHTYDGWAPADVTRFENMLRNVFLPKVSPGSQANGNWELSMAEATMGIGVFLDDSATFERGLALWRGRVPAYIYMMSDGAQPKQAPGSNKSPDNLIKYWQGQSTFVDGLCQETCRDLSHVQLGFAAMINGAETARIQGANLYGEEAARIKATYEFHANYLNGAAVPSWLCGGHINNVWPSETWEIGYNEYATRDGSTLPNTAKLVMDKRPSGVALIMTWETLTHANVGKVGIP